jgi:hypothetical protein
MNQNTSMMSYCSSKAKMSALSKDISFYSFWELGGCHFYGMASNTQAGTESS